MKRIELYIGILLLIIAVGFNLWVFRTETVALIDPNDNTFQFALVDRTNQMLTFAQQKCSGIFSPFCTLSLLVDHWVPNWAEGYNLPYYYSHVPQILIVVSYRAMSLLLPHLSLFTYYHWVIYLLLCLFPIAMFVSLRIIRLPWITAGTGALIATHLSTDGLYGIDPASFLWRGYGLSSQLFSMIWLPLALAAAYRYFSNESMDKSPAVPVRGLLAPALLLTATTAGHLGLGIIAFMSVAVLAVSPYIQTFLEQTWTGTSARRLYDTVLRLGILFGIVGLLLGYWILPILKDGNYHNISVWDGIWKFDSFGYRQVLAHLFNGDLFDFGRLPVLTVLIGIGIFASVRTARFPFAVLFVFWLLMYFGRTTWGGLFTLIPGMSEYHLSRFIVGVHTAGIFLIAIGIHWIVTTTSSRVPRSRHPAAVYLSYFVMVVALIGLVYPQTIRYAAHNDFLIRRSNQNYTKDKEDVALLLSAINRKLKTNPGRVFAGRGGSWGKSFRLAETPMYMHLSTFGIPVILWLPETWSPNSDTEQYFSENNPDHYTLYNVRLVATPADLPKEQIQPFWRLVEAGDTWKLYEVDTEGYISAGFRAAIVSSTKEDYRNVIRLWMHGGYPAQRLYPELTFDPAYPKLTGTLPNFRMTDEATYIVPEPATEGTPARHSLFAEPPRYMLQEGSPGAVPVIRDQQAIGDMTFSAVVETGPDCGQCIIVLRQTFHPSWRATINGNPAAPFAVFPFFTAIALDTPGTYNVSFSYHPSGMKRFLLLLGLGTFGVLVWIAVKKQ